MLQSLIRQDDMLDIEAVESILSSDGFIRDCQKNVQNIGTIIEKFKGLKSSWSGQEICKEATRYLQEVIDAIPSEGNTYLLGFFSDFVKSRYNAQTTAIETTLHELHDIKVKLEEVQGKFESKIRKKSFEDYLNDLIDGWINHCPDSVTDNVRYQLKGLLPPTFVAKIMGFIKTAINSLGSGVSTALRYVVKFLSYGAWIIHKIIDIIDSFTVKKLIDESIALMTPMGDKMNCLIFNMESIRLSIDEELRRIARENDLAYNDANLDVIKGLYYDSLF